MASLFLQSHKLNNKVRISSHPTWALLQLFALFRPFLRVCCKKTCNPVQGFVQRDYIAVAEFCLNHENVAKA